MAMLCVLFSERYQFHQATSILVKFRQQTQGFWVCLDFEEKCDLRRRQHRGVKSQIGLGWITVGCLKPPPISNVFWKYVQCGRSSLSQRWGADLRAYCSVKFPMTLKMGLERSQLFPEIFEIVLRPFWWAAGSEQSSPPLRKDDSYWDFFLFAKLWTFSQYHKSHYWMKMAMFVQKWPLKKCCWAAIWGQDCSL